MANKLLQNCYKPRFRIQSLMSEKVSSVFSLNETFFLVQFGPLGMRLKLKLSLGQTLDEFRHL